MNKSFWEDRYDAGSTGWDIGYASPPLSHYLDQIRNKNVSILIPGAGYGHEVVFLNKQGFTNVTVIDIAEAPMRNLSKKLPEGHGFELITADFFEHSGQYELIVEQTFFCALDPQMRLAYAEKMVDLLRPDGKLVGVLFDFQKTESGPPFGGSLAEYKNLFSKYFEIKTLERCTNSIKPRQGSELFFIFEKPQASKS
ncbi:MAG: methyltransferase domain-containing protein [Leeuwenhoekiella sp.]